MAEIVEYGGDCVFTHEDVRYFLATTPGKSTMDYTLYSKREDETSTLLQFTSKHVSILDKQRVDDYTIIRGFSASEGLLIVDKFLYLQFSLHPMEGTHLVLADIVSKELCVVPEDESTDSAANACTDRWNGRCKNGSPCGWGKSTNDKDCLVYEGFRVGSRDVCYGTYYNATGKVRYAGGLVDGCFWGPGEHFDVKGNLIHSGEWMWNRKRSSSATIKSYYNPIVISQSVTALTFGDAAGSSEQVTYVDFTPFKSLVTLTFTFCCFPHARQVRLCDLPLLTTVSVGEGCFFDMHTNRAGEKEFHVENCPQLTHLCIERLSFYSFTTCALSSRDGV